MTQIAIYAILARETYNLKGGIPLDKLKLPDNWTIQLSRIINDVWGNCFAVFTNNHTKEIVLSIRGTDNIMNIVTDVKLALSRIEANGFIPPGQDRLTELAQEILNSDLILEYTYTFKIIGFSLGGVMAELCAIKLGIQCITFESPGSLNIMQNHSKEDYPVKNYSLVTSYLSAPNVINTLNSHPGTIFRMYLPHANTKGASFLHTINCLANILFLNYGYYLCYNAASYISSHTFHTKKLANNQQNTIFTHQGIIINLLYLIKTKIGINPATWYKDLNWLASQHSIENIANFLLSNGKIAKMASWPTSVLVPQKQPKSRSTFNTLMVFSKQLLPFQEDQPGIRTMFNKDKMEEARIRKLPGYKLSF